ncbi:MAG: Amt family ammonium transporter [Nitriliruptoraceae bacterium]
MAGGDVRLLISTALVPFMITGSALFYGGLVRSKSVRNMLVMNTWCAGIVPLVWVTVGASLSGNGSAGNGLIRSLDLAFLDGVDGDGLLLTAFPMTFAAIAPALISGALIGRLGARGSLAFGGDTVIHINAGAAALAATALMDTFLAASGGMVAWLAVKRIKDGRYTVLGECSGTVVGLVAITPAAAYVGGLAGIMFGAVAGVVDHRCDRVLV